VTRPVLIDAFCCAGGATKGYQRAGFYVIGVDIDPQPNYCGDEFVQADALEFLAGGAMERADASHASPPCPRYSTVTPKLARDRHPDLIAETRDALDASDLPYVIENVVGSPLRDPVQLCGSSFGLDVRRHRLFESNMPLLVPACDHGWQTPRFRSLDGRMVKKGRLASVVGVHGNVNYAGEFELRCKAMGIDWMTNAELTQAIPPAYTELIGHQLMQVVTASRKAAA
jgi:DNA (cytosine-5)-methyltransferase 1